MEKETVEQVALRLYPEDIDYNDYHSIVKYDYNLPERIAFMEGAKWQAERMYSEEEVIEFLNKREDYLGSNPSIFDYLTNKEWFEQFKKK